MILALFKANKKKKRFYEGRKPNYEDVSVIADRLEAVKHN